jgi:RNA polymerase sigma-70 factor, ECF subfamily
MRGQTKEFAVQSCCSVDLPVTGDLSDEVLAAMAAQGHPVAFRRLYDRHKQRVFARLTKLIGVSPDRDDVMQQVFMQLHRSLPTFRGESKLTTFLYQIDHLRKRWGKVVDNDAAALDVLVTSLPDPSEHSHARQQLNRLFSMLDNIKPRLRVAFVLVVVEGLSFEEAAEQLGMRRTAVRQRVMRARNQLLELFLNSSSRSERPTLRRLA